MRRSLLQGPHVIGGLSLLLLIRATVTQAAGEQNFSILEYRVLGNSTLPVKAIEQAVMSHLGFDKSLKDVEAARTDLEAAYHKAGFGTVFVDIPEQTVAEGIVRLRVTEGRLNSAEITGARYFSERQIKAAVPAAAAGTVPSLPALQAQLSQVNSQSPDRSVVPVLKAGPVPGTVDLSLRVQDKLPVHGSVEVNNQYTVDTTSLRLLGNLSYGNLFGRLDTFSAQYETAPAHTDQVSVLAANYATHIGSGGEQLSAYVLHSNSNIATLGSVAVLGRGTVYGARFVVPLVRDADQLDTFTLGADYKDYGQVVNVSSSSSLSTPVSYTDLTAGFNESRTHGIAHWEWSVTANLGPRGAPNRELQFQNKRFDASADYFYVRADGSLILNGPAHSHLTLQLDGQYAVEPLISNEQFSIGGAASVRGYLETEALGDRGGRASLQLQAPAWQPVHLLRLEPFVFFDAARAITLDALQSDIPVVVLRSTGVGINFNALQCLSGNLTWADPLVAGIHTGAHDGRWVFAARCTW
ncbi:MAG TPA: ShlB/FhaC/HecB family hemolysin secretion/activation protein [Steroidobacteraceae bacterium]|nr:ShlB/FhaC/HecB family hemolysin secretion/activation protein [Steroidobacteraceae bacterium]